MLASHRIFTIAGGAVAGALVVATTLSTAVSAADSPDLAIVNRIKHEAFERSEVMKHVFYLTDVHGPRLTNSPGYDLAAQWIVDKANEWGLDNATLESWGPYGRGWSTSHFSAHMLEPRYAPLIGVPLAWTPSTAGVVEGVPVLAYAPTSLFSRGSDLDAIKADLEEYIEHWKGQLRGAIVMLQAP